MRAAATANSPARGKAFGAVAVIVPVMLYALLAGRRIMAGVGYQMDEALYVESAVYMLRGSGPPPFVHDAASFVSIGGRSWPIMIIPYVGALKAYVALPLFAAFGMSAAPARLAGVLLGGVGIAGLAVLVGTQAGWGAALIAGGCLAIHPAYVDFTVFDHGGTSVWMGAMGLVCLALVGHLRRRSMASAFLLGFAAGLGVWGRANVVWLIAAAAAAAAIAYGRRVRPTTGELAAAAAGGACGAAPLILYEIASRFATLAVMAAVRQPVTGGRLGARLCLMAELMVSARQLRGIWGGPGTLVWEIALGAVILALFVAAALARVAGIPPEMSRFRRALGICTLFLIGIMATSRLPVGQHHMAAVLAPGLAAVAVLAVETARRFRHFVPWLAAAGAGLVTVWLAWDVRIDRGLRRTGGLGMWSSALDDVNRDLTGRRLSPERLKILDWGFQDNLYVVSGGLIHGRELFWGATHERSSRGLPWGDEIREGGVFLLSADPRESAAARGFGEALGAAAGTWSEKVFRDRAGAPVAKLVEVGPVPGAPGR